jgi:hypothetical protein
MTADEETLGEEQKASPVITKFPNAAMWNNMQGVHKILLVPEGSLNDFFYIKRKRKKWGLEQSNVPRPFVKGTFVVHRF